MRQDHYSHAPNHSKQQTV